MEDTVSDILQHTNVPHPLEDIEIISSGNGNLVDTILPKNGEHTEHLALIPATQETSKKTKRSINNEFTESCPICSDRVSGYHYGILTCESCKGFFKRTVQNKKNYQCVEKGSCVINKLQRKRCPACRYEKCLFKGMKLEAVRADRLRGGRNKFGPLYKQDRAIKQQKLAMSQSGIEQRVDSIDTGPHSSVPIKYRAPEGVTIKKENVAKEDVRDYYIPERYQRIPQNAPMVRRPHYQEIFQPYLQPPQLPESGDGRLFYSYPYADPRYFPQMISPYHRTSLFQTPASGGAGHHLLRIADDHDQKEIFYREPYNVNYERNLRYSQGQQQNYQANAPPPDPREQTPGFNTFRVGNGVDRGEFVNSNLSQCGTVSSFTNDQHQLQPSTITRTNPFQCSNAELIKRMVESWIPEEDVRKRAQKAMKGTEGLTHFQIICKINEQILVALVNWAKGSLFFQDMRTEDQMSLLHETWSELVLLDHIYRQVWFSNEGNILLISGQSLPISSVLNGGIFDIGASKIVEKVIEMTNRFRQLQIDRTELVCLKFLILFDAKDSKQANTQFMNRVSERINQVLFEYVNQTYTDQDGRFLQLIMKLPELRAASQKIETWLWERKESGFIDSQTLMAEMLDVRFRNSI